jgi:hypothetical protein
MTRALVTLALLLSTSLFACTSGTGDVPGPGCTSIQTTSELPFDPQAPAGTTTETLCLSRAPTVSTKGEGACIALHATKATSCSCPADQGLQAVSAAHEDAVGKFFDKATGTAVVASCVCEVKQLTSDDGASYAACIEDATTPVVDPNGKAVNGYCYVDPGNTATNAELVKDCAATEKQAMRFVGRPGTLQAGDISVVVLCETDICDAASE